MRDKLEKIIKAYEELEKKLSDPAVASDIKEFTRLNKEYAHQSDLIAASREYIGALDDIEAAKEMLHDTTDADEKEMLQMDISENEAKLPQLEEDIKYMLIPSDPNDDKNTIVEIRSAAGGDEAAIFAGDLYKMYQRFCESRGWKTTVLDSSPSEAGGFKSIEFKVEGDRVYSVMKFESGVHRVQRVPKTESQGRIQTSTATVAVLPEAEEIDVQINQSDLRIDTYCASGPGGQCVNTTYSAVRITHLPTNTVVQSQEQRSQIQNREVCMQMLRARLYEMELEKQQAELGAERQSQIGHGNRSEKIRTYNQPQDRVTDHRIGFNSTYNGVLLGDQLGTVIEALAAGRGSAARDRYIFREGRGEHGELPPNEWQSLFGGPAWQQVDDGQWYLHMFAKEQPDLNWKNPDVHEEFKKTLRFWSDHGTDGFRIDVAHGLAKDLDSVPLADMDPAAVQHVLPADGAFSPLWDRPEVHDIYREWRQVFNEYNPPRFAVGEAWVKAESQHLYASTDELGQVFNFEFAEANWFADEFRTAIADGLRAAEETHGSTTTWVMNNHDVPRSPSRFGLPQVKDAPYHQLAHDWLLRDGETYRENRELGTRRARAAALMELGLPGSAYVYQGEELGLFEVANIPWDRLEDPTPFNTRRNFTDKGRDGCRAPMPWKAADCGEPASWSPDFITGGTFGFGPEQGDSADAHLPQPAWFKDFAADVEADDNGSMLHLYRKLLQLRQTVLTATGDTSADLLDMGDTVVAYSRPATEGRRFLSVTNFGDEPIALPDDAVAIANSVPLTDDGKLDSDASVWLLLG